MRNEHAPTYEPPALSVIGSIEQLTLVESDATTSGTKPT